MAQPQLVTFSRPAHGEQQPKALKLNGAAIIIDRDDFAGVRIAANNLAEDFGRVTKSDPSPIIEYRGAGFTSPCDTVIIIGSVASSSTIQTLVNDGQLQVEQIRGKWECFTTAVVDKPKCINGCHRALVLCGSDKRGAIFAAYTLSEQIGVSP